MKNEAKNNEEIENRIVKIVQKEIKDKEISITELEKMILREIEKVKYLSEDWSKHYAKERIKERVKEKNSNFLPTTRTRRFLNFVLDYAGLYVFAYVFGYILGITGLYFILEYMNEWFLGMIILLLYYVIFESIWSKTPAKFITKTKVITENGEKPDYKTILIRTLVRFVPLEAFTFLSPERPRGWHDKWSKTIVIDDTSISKKEIRPQELEFPEAGNQEVVPEQMISYCGKCGKKIDKHDKFCSKCGTKI